MNIFKEWLSDNLRYLLLLLGIAVGVTVIVIGVNAYQTLQMPRSGAGAASVKTTQSGSEVSNGGSGLTAAEETEEETEELTEEVSEEETDSFVTAVEELLEEAEELFEDETEALSEAEVLSEDNAEVLSEDETEALSEEETDAGETAKRFNGNVTISSADGELITGKAAETETETETETLAQTETETQAETETETETDNMPKVRVVYVNRETETETEIESESETGKKTVKEVKAGLDVEPATEAKTEAASAADTTNTPAEQAETAVDIETMIQQGLVEELERDPDAEGPTAFEETIDPNKTAYLRDEASYLASTNLAAGAGAGLDTALDNTAQQGTQTASEGSTPATPAVPVPVETEPETEPREIDTLKNMTPVTKYAGSMMNIRTAPDAESEIITSVDTGTELTVNGETTNWYRVMVNQKVGYASKSLVTDVYTPVYGTLISTCYMRSNADYGDNIIGEYYGGTPLEILQNDGGWTKVRINGVDGYVGTKFVSYN